jgi:hypothetical protein
MHPTASYQGTSDEVLCVARALRVRSKLAAPLKPLQFIMWQLLPMC